MKRRPSYFWALRINERDPRLHSEGQEGLGYALQLARDATERRKEVLLEPLIYRRTVADVASDDGVSETTVRRRIATARRELFGNAADRTIYHRLRRHDNLFHAPTAYCQIQGCQHQLPQQRTKRRRRCDQCQASDRRAYG